MVSKIKLCSSESGFKLLLFQGGNVAMNQWMKVRHRNCGLLALSRYGFRHAWNPVALPRKRICGSRDTPRSARLVQEAPIDFGAGHPKLPESGKVVRGVHRC